MITPKLRRAVSVALYMLLQNFLYNEFRLAAEYSGFVTFTRYRPRYYLKARDAMAANVLAFHPRPSCVPVAPGVYDDRQGTVLDAELNQRFQPLFVYPRVALLYVVRYGHGVEPRAPPVAAKRPRKGKRKWSALSPPVAEKDRLAPLLHAFSECIIEGTVLVIDGLVLAKPEPEAFFGLFSTVRLEELTARMV